MKNANIANHLAEVARRVPDRVAVRDLSSGTTRTYAELATRAAKIAAGFRNQDLRPGERVALLLRNSAEYVEVFFGAVAAGLVVVPLNTRLTVQDYSHMLTDAGCSALVTEPHFLPTVQDVDAEGPLVIDIAGSAAHTSLVDLLDPDPIEPVPREADDLCSVMYTSGTTGKPKAVMLSHGAWTSVSETAEAILPFTDGMEVLHSAPLTHGAGFLMLPTLRHAGVNVTTVSFDPAATAEFIAAGNVQGMFMVPSMIRMLLDALPEEWRAPDEFGWIYYAGSPIDADTLREAARRFDGRLVQSFAQMEAPMFLTSLGMEAHRAAENDPSSDIARSAGYLIPGREVRIVDPGGKDVPTGDVGEIIARAPQMMLGYWNRAEATRETMQDGLLHTGDLGYLDTDGRLFVVDRVKDMIVSGGSNVYAREVEDALVDADGIAEVAVIGLPHRVWGEEVTAVVVPEPGRTIDEESLRSHCRQRLAGYKVPKRVIRVETLPRNPYGKVLKRELRNELADVTDAIPPATVAG